jgi:hypothetical protein
MVDVCCVFCSPSSLRCCAGGSCSDRPSGGGLREDSALRGERFATTGPGALRKAVFGERTGANSCRSCSKFRPAGRGIRRPSGARWACHHARIIAGAIPERPVSLAPAPGFGGRTVSRVRHPGGSTCVVQNSWCIGWFCGLAVSARRKAGYQGAARPGLESEQGTILEQWGSRQEFTRPHGTRGSHLGFACVAMGEGKGGKQHLGPGCSVSFWDQGGRGGTFVPTTEQCLGSAAGGKGCRCDVGRQHGSRSGARALPKEASWSPRLPSLPFALPPSTPGKPCQLFLLTLPAPWRPGDHVVPPEIARELVHGTLPGHTGLRGVLRAPPPPRPPPAPGDGPRANPCLPPPSPARHGARVGGGAGLAGTGAPGCPETARGRRRPQPAAKPAPRPAFRPPRAQPARRPATTAHRGSPPAPTACMNPLLARPRGVPAGASRGPRSSVAERPSVPGAPGAGPREGGDDERTPCRGEGGLARRARGTGCGGWSLWDMSRIVRPTATLGVRFVVELRSLPANLPRPARVPQGGAGRGPAWGFLLAAGPALAGRCELILFGILFAGCPAGQCCPAAATGWRRPHFVRPQPLARPLALCPHPWKP